MILDHLYCAVWGSCVLQEKVHTMVDTKSKEAEFMEDMYVQNKSKYITPILELLFFNSIVTTWQSL